MGMLSGDLIERLEHSIGGTVHVGRVRRQRRCASRHCHRLHLVKHNHCRHLVVSEQRNVVAEQLEDLLLRLTMFGTHQPMRVYFDEANLATHHQAGELMCKAAGERRLACTRWAVQQDEAMKGRDVEGELGPERETEHHGVQETILHLLVRDDGVPGPRKTGRRLDLVSDDALGDLHAAPFCELNERICSVP